MKRKFCLVITSIAGSDNPVLQQYAETCRQKEIDFIVAGDRKSPTGFNLPGCEFLGIEDQERLPYKLAKLLPENSYARKNLAYLHAIKKGIHIIVETDDDNIPSEEFWEERTETVEGAVTPENEGWINIYRYFSDRKIWPRGFPLSQLKKQVSDRNKLKGVKAKCLVQQGLADGNPDVDAVYRLWGGKDVTFIKEKPVILGKNCFCPFNSQNTTWFAEAFPLLYLPSFCSFRVTDIWRSFVAQRLLATCDFSVSFHPATVKQVRNEHDLAKDFAEEVSGYLYNDTIMQKLNALELPLGPEHLNNNLLACYRILVKGKFIGASELPLLEAWLDDLETAFAS